MERAFAEQWESARYNNWYWLSYAAMFVIPVIGSWYVSFMLARQTVLRRVSHIILATACANLAAESSFQAVEQKWQERSAAATTPEQRHTVAMSDGGNLAFAAVSAPACGAISLGLWVAVAVRCGPKDSSGQNKRGPEHL